jgi:hypothetical protein
MDPDDLQGADVNVDIESRLRREFAACDPDVADEDFVRRTQVAIGHRRRRRRALAALGVAVPAVLLIVLAPRLAPLVDLVEKGAAVLTTLAGDAPSSLSAAALLGALVLAAAAVSWTLRSD